MGHIKSTFQRNKDRTNEIVPDQIYSFILHPIENPPLLNPTYEVDEPTISEEFIEVVNRVEPAEIGEEMVKIFDSVEDDEIVKKTETVKIHLLIDTITNFLPSTS